MTADCSFPDTMAGAAVALVRLDEGSPWPGPTPEDEHDAGRRWGQARQLFLLRRAACRRFLGDVLGMSPDAVVLGYGAKGEPRLVRPARGGFISVSGQGSWASFALSETPVGIDLALGDAGEPPWFAVTAAESERLRAEPEPDRAALFLRIWTAKEAYLKARGTGLWRDPATIDIARQDDHRFAVRDGAAAASGLGETIERDAAGTRLTVSVWRDAAMAGSGRGWRNPHG